MTHEALTFSEIADRSYKATVSLLKTYMVGAIVLVGLSLVLRGIAAGLFSIADMPEFHSNLVVVLMAGIIGVACAVASVLLQILQTMYALVVAVDRSKDVKISILKAWRYLWRLILGGIWIMLRSFAWITCLAIPFLAVGAIEKNFGVAMIGVVLFIAGIICAIVFLPRLSFTNVIQLKDGTGIRVSANLSLQRTQGYWGKIVGNNLLVALSMGLLTVAIFMASMLIVVALAGTIRALGPFMALLVGIPLGLVAVISGIIYIAGVTLFVRMYLVELYETIKDHPKVKA